MSNISRTVLDYNYVSDSTVRVTDFQVQGGVLLKTVKGKCTPLIQDINYVLKDVETNAPLSLTGNSIPNWVIYEADPALESSGTPTFLFVATDEPENNTNNSYEVIQSQTVDATDISLENINNKYTSYLAVDGKSGASYNQSDYPYLAIRVQDDAVEAGTIYVTLNYYKF